MNIVKDVISEDLCKQCNMEIDQMIEGEKWSVSNINWDKNLQEGYTGTCLAAKVSPSIKLKVLSAIRKHLPKVQQDKYYLQYHYWLHGSGIQWHDDETYKFGATLYLNTWNKRWGGLFLWENDEGIHGEMPEPRKLVVVEKDPHSVTPILSHAPYPRRAIQIWGYM